jgi:hypothetical protein
MFLQTLTNAQKLMEFVEEENAKIRLAVTFVLVALATGLMSINNNA